MFDPSSIRLLIVDDQEGVRELCAAIGGRMGLRCSQAAGAVAALEQMADESAALMLADLELGGSSGLALLAEVKRRWPLTEVALMGSYGSLENASEAMRLGAYDFVVKPFRVEEFQRVLERMAEKARLVQENEYLRTQVETLGGCVDGLEELERLTVQRVFEQVDGDIEQAQSLLGISRATLYRKIKRYGIKTRPARRKASELEIFGTGQKMAGVSRG